MGQSADTPQFAVNASARLVRRSCGAPTATQLLIEADGGGSNGARSRVWKAQLQEHVADRFGWTVTVLLATHQERRSGIQIERRLSADRRRPRPGAPFQTFKGIAGLRRRTTTSAGLVVQADWCR